VTGLIDYDQFCGIDTSADASGRAADGESGEIDAPELAAMLADRAAGRRDFTLVDVREPFERDIVDIPGSVLLPLADLLDAPDGDAVPEGPLVLYCKSGGRSARALAALTRAGRPDVVHLAGGVLAWVAAIEPDRPTY
jgi:adenylyltransferase/sulfurtransferase